MTTPSMSKLTNERPDIWLRALTVPRCDCGAAATCYGSYEGQPASFACDDCCGHGNEDGRCRALSTYDKEKANG